MRVTKRFSKPRGRGKNDAIVTEAKLRLLLQHSHPDHEVSKSSSDSHRSLTGLELECREWRQSVYPC